MASSNDDVQCPRPWERRTYAHETITSHGRSAPAAGGKTAGEHAGVGCAPAGRADGWDQLKGPRAVAFLFRVVAAQVTATSHERLPEAEGRRAVEGVRR